MMEHDVEKLLRGTEPVDGPALPSLSLRDLRPATRPEAPEEAPREARLHRRTAMAAAGLILVLTTWALLHRRPVSPVKPDAAPPGAERVRQDPPTPEDLLQKDPELRARILQVAQEEKSRLARFETRLGEIEKGLREAEKDFEEKRVKEASERSSRLLGTFPAIELAVLDPSAIEYRARVLRLRLEIFWNSAQLAQLKESPLPVENRAEAQMLLVNRSHKLKVELQEVEVKGPQPRHQVIQSIGGTVASPADATRDLLRSIRITIDMKDSPFKDVIDYFREVTGLNFVLRGTTEERGRLVAVRLKDAIFEGAVQEIATLANYKWEINSFGMVVLSPAHP